MASYPFTFFPSLEPGIFNRKSSHFDGFFYTGCYICRKYIAMTPNIFTGRIFIFLIVVLLPSLTGNANGQAHHDSASPDSLFACFSNIPDNDSTRYSLALLVTIPSGKHPRALFSWPRGKLGHVFLELSKSNGSQRMVQYVGFYALSPALAFCSGQPVPSRMKDNGRHPYNARMTMQLTSAQFKTVLRSLVQNARKKYSVYQYNCVNYALDVVNSVRLRPLRPPSVHVPGLLHTNLITPNAVYRLLCHLPAVAKGETINVLDVPALAEVSHGPCS
jgi:hypothetical protein